MGSYTFKWEHPAEEVYVTGTFDNWTKSVKLNKEGGVFQKSVKLEKPTEKIYYKFVVDNTWTTNESSPKEADQEGNINNYLTPDDIAPATISSAAPGSSTAIMAGQQPLEKDKPVGINPLPAADGGVNPVSLKPGEKIPENLTGGDINKHVKLDKESYEKSDSLVGGSQPAAINSVGAGTTTAALAGQVPVESKAGESTSGADERKKKKNKKKNNKKKNKTKAGAASTNNGNGNDNENDTNEDNSENEVPTAAIVGGAAAAVGAAVTAAAAAATNAASESTGITADTAKAAATEALNKNLPGAVKEKLPVAAQETLAANNTKPAPEVPSEVTKSLEESGKSPEAAASAPAVSEKKAVESELLKEVKPAPAIDAKRDQPVKAAATPEATKSATQAAPALDPALLVMKPAEPASGAKTETKPVQAAPVAAIPIESKPAQARPAEVKLAEPKATVNKPVETKPVQAHSAESKPIDSKVAESKPVVTAPVASKPSDSKPIKTEPAAAKPATAGPEAAQKSKSDLDQAKKGTKQEPNKTEGTANGSSSKPTETSSAADKDKKKGRLSTILSKIKHKLAN